MTSNVHTIDGTSEPPCTDKDESPLISVSSSIKENDRKNSSWRLSTNRDSGRIRIHRFRHKVLPNGDFYDCEFVDNQPDGRGVFTSRRGHEIMTYDGSCYSGLFQGEGIQTWARLIEGEVQYDGRMKDDY